MELTGTLLGGRYRVGRELGHGGMGVVYEAVQEGLDRPVALKVMYEHLASDLSIRERFKREARAVAMIRHPNVVQINDYVEPAEHPPFLVMEKLTGETLRDVMGRGERISGERMARIALQVLSALDAAHRAKVVHRDIKPDNIFLEQTTAQRDIVKLLDFGVAKFVGESDEAVRLTRVGHAIGTPSFMAPEQAVGDSVDGRADLYALGATMFVALTGKKIYEVRDAADLVRTIMTTVPPSVTTLRPDVHPDLSRVIACALEKNASARYANAMEMTRALSPFGRLPTSMVEAIEGPPTVLDPVVDRTAPMIETRALPMSVWIAILAFLELLLLGVIGALLYVTTHPTGEPPVTHAGAPTEAASLVPLATAGEISTLTPPPAASSAESIPSYVIPPAVTAAPTSASSLVEPPECRTARMMKAQGRDRQAAQLSIVCMRKGGQPPF